MRLTFLGTGTSFGVPQVGCHCAVCRSTDPRDRRTRTGALVETDAGTRLLVDTPPELRLQLVASGVDRADAVLYTHEHADHIHGIDDVRAFTVHQDEPLPLHGSAETLATIAARFPYIVDDRLQPLPGTSKPNGRLVPVTPGVPFRVREVDVLPVAVPHGRTSVLAYRIGALGYVTDAKTLSADARAAFAGVRVMVLNALWWRAHPTHMSVDEAVAVAGEIGAERTFLTHLTHDNFHAALAERLPPGIAPAYDGLVVDL